ncbi:MAG: nickel-responsive transcriptional regulator NikR [Candidatus Njordarchaeum guaymaensis]
MRRNVTRISMSLPEDLLLEFDSIIKDFGFTDRSKAIQIAMKNFISELKAKGKEEEFFSGAIVILYDHHTKGLEEILTDLEHEFLNIINSKLHIHLDRDHCMEVIIVRGKYKNIRNLAKKLTTQRGIREVKISVLSVPTH